MDDVALALDSPSPLDLLTLVSRLLSALDPRAANPFRDWNSEPGLTVAEFVQTLIEVPSRETTALLATVAALTGDDLLAARIRRELATRRFPLPKWIAALADATPEPPIEVSHVLGEGDSVLLGARLAGHGGLTAVVFVDHNLGTVVKDAFVIDDSIERVASQISQHLGSDADTTIAEVGPAVARARAAEAIEHGAITYPPYETDTWPGCRPLVEWLCAALPPGGTGYERREWTDLELDELAERFFASPYGRELSGDADARSLLESLLWYGSAYSTGDPLRWSPPKIEVLMLDWIPRKIVAPTRYLAGAPDVLRAFIRFGHAEVGLRDKLTVEAIAAVDDFDVEYQRLIASPRPQGPAALLAAMGALDPDGPWEDLPESWEEFVLEDLQLAVGGAAALQALDDTALPEEEFDCSAIAPDIADTVHEVRAVLDDVVGAVLGGEYRTACRRLLHRVAAGDATVFRRRARAQISAAALCWIVAKANRLFYPGPDQMLVKDLLAHFGVTGSVSQRARAFLVAGDFGIDLPYEIDLGTPDLLVSTRRRQILEQRDRFSADP